MYRSHKARFTHGAILAALAISTFTTVMGQSTPPTREVSIITIVTIKPEMRTEYEGWQKEVSAAYKKVGIPARAVLDTVMGDLMQYVSTVPLAHFADLDGASIMDRALGKDEAASFMRKGSGYVNSVQRFASVSIPDMSIYTKAPEPAEYALITSFQLMPGKESEWSAWMKNDYLPAMKKAEVKNFWVSADSFGADPNTRILVRLMKNLAEFDASAPLVKALGEDGARKLRAKSAGIIASVHYSVLHYRADLSYDTRMEPAQTTASAK